MKKVRLSFLVILLASYYLPAAELPVEDSIRTYRLGEVTAIAGKERSEISPSRVNKVDYYEIQRMDAVSVSGLGRIVPSAFIQTNSRGETLLFLRGSGERQLGLYFDGALLNIPWDNRMDISQIPTDIIGRLTVNTGAGSILYGANILGGAVDITTMERTSEGFGGIARLQYEDSGSQLASLTHDGRIGNFNYITNISYHSSAGFLLPEELRNNATIENQKQNTALRTNTDQERLSAYARMEYKFAESTTLGLSFNHIDAEMGVAPLTEEKPDKVRYWRYPEWKRTMLTFNGEHVFDFDKDIVLRATLWLDKFDQTIDSYSDISYSDMVETQNDDDLTFGGRLALRYTLNKCNYFTLGVNRLSTGHEETVHKAGELFSEFSQNLSSAGAEYTYESNGIVLSAGAVFDHNETPETGVFEDSKGSADSDYGMFIGGIYRITNESDFYANFSRRTRFPTLREAFSGALGKFKPNPGLRPETGLLFETGYSLNVDSFELNISGFANFYDGLIAKVSIPDDPQNRKTRVNYSEARVIGIEASFRYDIIRELGVRGNLTYLYSDGEMDGDYLRHLEYKPDYIGTLIGTYEFGSGLQLQPEAELTGRQFGENSRTGELEEIRETVLFNLRFAYTFNFPGAGITDVFIRANNIFDAVNYNKIGLPGAGRTIVSGAAIRI